MFLLLTYFKGQIEPTLLIWPTRKKYSQKAQPD